MHDLNDIKCYLKILKLDETKIPTMAEHKKAFRDLLVLHPDKNVKDGVEDTTEEFQKITEAVDIVLEFIIRNPQLNTRRDTKEHKETLKLFEKQTNIAYNSESVTFYIDPIDVEAWRDGFEKKLGDGVAMTDKVGIQYKMDDWSIDSVSTTSKPVIGSVSVCFWPHLNKVLLQGKHYLAFLAFALPTMIKTVAKKAIVTDVKNSETVDLEVSPQEDDVMVDTFKTLETKVVALRNDLVDKVDLAVQEISASNEKTVQVVNKKIETLEATLDSNKSELEKISIQLAIIVDQTKDNGSISEVSRKALAKDIAKATFEGTNFDIIEKTILEVKKDVEQLKVDDVLETNKKIVVKLDAVGSMAVAFQEGLTKLDDIFKKNVFNEVAENSAKSAEALQSMNKHMVTLVAKMSAPTSHEPTNVSSNGEKVDDKTDKKSIKSRVDSGVRNAKMFSSSIALQCDKAELESGLNCTIVGDVVETYHITKHAEARDPELFLKKLIDDHLKDDSDIDFVIFAVGSNDISKLNIEQDDINALSTKACEHSTKLVEIANYAVETYEVDVFIVERPPRYDKEKFDPKGLKQLLSQTSNGYLMSLITPLKDVHLIKLPGLENLTPKARRGVFQHDGIHLTRHGASIMADLICSGVRKVYKDIPVPVDVPFKNQFNTPPPKVPHNPVHHGHGHPQQTQYGPRPGVDIRASLSSPSIALAGVEIKLPATVAETTTMPGTTEGDRTTACLRWSEST